MGTTDCIGDVEQFSFNGCLQNRGRVIKLMVNRWQFVTSSLMKTLINIQYLNRYVKGETLKTAKSSKKLLNHFLPSPYFVFFFTTPERKSNNLSLSSHPLIRSSPWRHRNQISRTSSIANTTTYLPQNNPLSQNKPQGPTNPNEGCGFIGAFHQKFSPQNICNTNHIMVIKMLFTSRKIPSFCTS